MAKARVYATTMPSRNIYMGNARAYGELIYVFSRMKDWGTWESFMVNYDREYDHMEQTLGDFRAEEDYFLPIGEQVPSLICAAYLGARCGTFTMLVWNGRSGAYEPLEVSVGEYGDTEDNGGDDGGAEDDPTGTAG